MMVELMMLVNLIPNIGDDANCGDSDSKVDCAPDLDGADGDSKDGGNVNDDGFVDSSIGNAVNCRNDKSQTGCCEDTMKLVMTVTS